METRQTLNRVYFLQTISLSVTQLKEKNKKKFCFTLHLSKSSPAPFILNLHAIHTLASVWLLLYFPVAIPLKTLERKKKKPERERAEWEDDRRPTTTMRIILCSWCLFMFHMKKKKKKKKRIHLIHTICSTISSVWRE